MGTVASGGPQMMRTTAHSLQEPSGQTQDTYLTHLRPSSQESIFNSQLSKNIDTKVNTRGEGYSNSSVARQMGTKTRDRHHTKDKLPKTSTQEQRIQNMADSFVIHHLHSRAHWLGGEEPSEVKTRSAMFSGFQ